jgi:hypothetical protein
LDIMETVNKVINTASNAIWGENDAQSQQAQQSHDEPISGVQGKGFANDPFDAGNRDEQPGAPISDANTAPQEPKLDGEPQMSVPQPAASSTLDKPSTLSTADAASSTAATGTAPSTAAIGTAPSTTTADVAPSPTTADAAPSTATADAPSGAATTGAPSAAAAAHSTSSTATGGSSSTPAEDSGVTFKTPEKEQREPREAEDPEKTKKQQEAGRRGTTVIMQDHGVSREALKGPQDGKAAHTAAEFEKEGKHGASHTKSNESKGESGKSTSSKGSDKSSGGAMSKMKESLKKVVHPHSSKQ